MATKAAITHVGNAHALSGNAGENAPRQMTATLLGGGNIARGFSNQAAQDIWLAQNAFMLDEITSNRG